jgi:tyrosyl-tRNA synthetase
MSKTYNNCVYLEETAIDMYGKLMSMPDNLITAYMECCTDMPMSEVAAEKTSARGITGYK